MATGVVKRLLVGNPLATARMRHTLLPKWLALPVFCSDPISSVAYATEEILLVLAAGGAAALAGAPWIAVVVALLLVVVIASYRQTCHAYPSGGGTYAVSKANLGETAALIAAAALLVDYVMTVAVSVVAGVVAITSAIPSWSAYQVEISVGFVLLLTLANLRGVKESGRLFAVPTYAFITPAHDAFWAAARAARGDREGTRLLIEVLLLHRHLASEFVVAGITATLHAGSTSPDLVAIESRKAEKAHRDAHPLLDEQDYAELGIDTMADTAVIAVITETTDPRQTPGPVRPANGAEVISLHPHAPKLRERPLPSLDIYDQLLTRRQKGTTA